MRSRQTKGTKSYLPFIIIGGVLAVAVGAGAVLYRKSETSPSSPSTAATSSPANTGNPGARPQTQTASRATEPANLPPGAQPTHARGGDSAAVTIEEFGDFQCPSCARLYADMRKIDAQYGSKIRVVFRNYPLAQLHEHAVDAARAAEAAGRQNRFWEMHDTLYQKQDEWKNEPDVRALFAEYARTLGLNVEQFKSDMNAPALTERILADQTRARALGVTGTPTLFINGREVNPDTQTLDGLRRQIDAALAATNK